MPTQSVQIQLGLISVTVQKDIQGAEKIATMFLNVTIAMTSIAMTTQHVSIQSEATRVFVTMVSLATEHTVKMLMNVMVVAVVIVMPPVLTLQAVTFVPVKPVSAGTACRVLTSTNVKQTLYIVAMAMQYVTTLSEHILVLVRADF